MAKKASVPKSVYQLKITLKEIKPPIWRRVLVESDITLYDLHQVIQQSMGWDDYHLHEFRIAGEHFGAPDPDGFVEVIDDAKTRLHQVIRGEKMKFLYEYDFGDGWRHEIVVEKVLPAEKEGVYPVCLKGKRACPPEDVGGPWGYAEFLEAIADPENSQHEDMLEWVGGEFDPEAFDLEMVNHRLAIVGIRRGA